MKTIPDLHPDDGSARRDLRHMLVRLREDSGISQRQLAARIGAAGSAVARFETREPRRCTLAGRIAAGLHHRVVAHPDGVPGGPYDDPTVTLFRPSDPAAAVAWDQQQLKASLVAARTACGWTQARLAAALGVNPHVVSVFERSGDVPLLATCQRYLRVLGGHLWIGVESGWPWPGVSTTPNEVLPCGTPSARRRHAALGQECRVCEPTTPAAARPNPPTISRQEAAA